MHRFFSSQNIVDALSAFDLARSLDYKEAIYAMERCTCSSLYVIDYQKQTFEYVSKNPLFLCGLTAEEIQEMGYAFYFKYVEKADFDLLVKVNKIGFDFFDGIPLNEIKLHTISYDFHLKSDLNRKILVNQKFTPVFLTESGKIWKALCMVSLSSNKNAGNIKIFKNGSNQVLEYNLLEEKWKTVERIKFSDREKEILQLSIRGFTINEIACAIFVTPETVKFHRKNIFDKTGVTNMSEAIFYAANNKLL